MGARTIWHRISAGLDLGFYRRSRALLLALGLQGLYLGYAHAQGLLELTLSWASLASVLHGLLACALLFHLANLVCGRRRWGVASATLVLLGLGFILVRFHAVTRSSLEFDLLWDNLGEIGYSESAAVIFGELLTPATLVPLVALLAGACLLEVQFRTLSRPSPPARRTPAALACALAYLGLALVPRPSTDELAFFAQTIVLRARGVTGGDETRLLAGPVPGYPLARPGSAPARLPADRPATPVFLLFFESFDPDVVEHRLPDGRAVTPVFDAKLAEGLSVERFYGNSIQTSKGWTAGLCSLIPSLKGKVAVRNRDLRLRCLPTVLAEAGYHTRFYTGFRNLGFDRAGEFTRKIGFEHVQAMEDGFLSPAERARVWGWGLQDDFFYRRVFADLDELPDDRPLFVVLANISNHLPFTDMPPDAPRLFENPRDAFEVYANSVHVADAYLGVFFQELAARPRFRDSLVIVTGDHGYPIGQHGITFSDTGAFEEHFRTPLLVLWPGHLAPGRIADRAASQLDLAPSLLDWLGIETCQSFAGEPLRRSGATPRPVPLVQPYDGRTASAVLWPHKLTLHLRSRRWRLVDLAADPLEQHDVLDEFEDFERLQILEEAINRILVNQQLIDENRIWPALSAGRLCP